MTKILGCIAAVALMGAAALPLPANAAGKKSGITSDQAAGQVTDMSSQRRYHRRHYVRRHWAPRRYYGPRYGYYGPRYGYYGYPHAYGYPYYSYYRPGPFVSFGVGPFGFRVF